MNYFIERTALTLTSTLLLFVVACGGCDNRDRTEVYKERLIGTWNIHDTYEGGSATGISSYLADGTATSSGTVVRGSRTYQLEVEGKWSLDGNRISYVVEKSNSPDSLPVGTRIFDDIIELTDDTLVLRTRQGIVVTRKKVPEAHLL